MRTAMSASSHRWKERDLIAITDDSIAARHILIDRGAHRPRIRQFLSPGTAALAQQFAQRFEIAHAGGQRDLLRRLTERFAQPCKIYNSNHRSRIDRQTVK